MNCARVGSSTVSGGYGNTVSGTFSGISGGTTNIVSHTKSFIIGANLTSTADCTTFMNNGVVACHLQVGGTTVMNTTTGRIDASNDVVAFATSDKRLKGNITPIENALNKVSQVQGIEFDWIPKEGVHGNEGHDVGVLAQEIEKVLPEVVTTRDNGYKAVKYEKIIPLLVEAIKELQKDVQELKNNK